MVGLGRHHGGRQDRTLVRPGDAEMPDEALSASVASVSAKAAPMQIRGPAPNGI